jgi:serpin B
MPHPALSLVLRHLRRAPRPAGAGAPTDGDLLGRFAECRDEAAFELLLRRHGAMVWNVCRRVLGDATDADDAFQATFLVLVRKAKSIAKRDSVASWLHGVAHRVALDARARAARRRAHEQRRIAMPAEEPPPDGAWAELRQVLDEELGRLPERFRAPVVLCYLEGKTNDEAAEQLGCARGTIASRLSRARDLLRGRLTRRGVALTAAALATALAGNAASAAVPAGLLTTTLRAAVGYAAATGAASPAAVSLAEGALRAMFMTKLKVAAAVLSAVIILGAGAGWLWPRAQAEPPRPQPQPVGLRSAPAEDPPKPKPADPAKAQEDRPALVEGNTRFALDLYAQLRQSEGNVAYSPYSISTALAMTRAGARGATADEMDKVLHFTLPQERLHPAAGALVRDLSAAPKGKKPNYQLTVANALWGQKNFGFLAEFRNLTRTDYGAELTEVDFVNAREEARKTINAAVEKQTNEKVKELLKPDHLTPATRLVLTNAIYFKAEWETKFPREGTREQPFQLTAERKVKVPTMARTAKFPYLDGDTFQVVELPYAGKDLSMLVLLPKKADGLPELEKALTAQKLAEWHGKLREAEVLVYLPKFKMTGAFELKEVLKAMGMERAFDRNRADFSGMNGGHDLFIQNVIHQAFVDVNEEGTEAAGATAVVMGLGGPPPRPVPFRADHPFVFLVRDNRSGSVLFLGRVADPTK